MTSVDEAKDEVTHATKAIRKVLEPLMATGHQAAVVEKIVAALGKLDGSREHVKGLTTFRSEKLMRLVQENFRKGGDPDPDQVFSRLLELSRDENAYTRDVTQALVDWATVSDRRSDQLYGELADRGWAPLEHCFFGGDKAQGLLNKWMENEDKKFATFVVKSLLDNPERASQKWSGQVPRAPIELLGPLVPRLTNAGSDSGCRYVLEKIIETWPDLRKEFFDIVASAIGTGPLPDPQVVSLSASTGDTERRDQLWNAVLAIEGERGYRAAVLQSWPRGDSRWEEAQNIATALLVERLQAERVVGEWEHYSPALRLASLLGRAGDEEFRKVCDIAGGGPARNLKNQEAADALLAWLESALRESTQNPRVGDALQSLNNTLGFVDDDTVRSWHHRLRPGLFYWTKASDGPALLSEWEASYSKRLRALANAPGVKSPNGPPLAATPPPAAEALPMPPVNVTDPILVPKTVLLQLLTALHTRPLVLLAGISGSGKTQLARRIGQARAEGWIEGATAMAQLVELAKRGLIAPATDTGAAAGTQDGWWKKLADVKWLRVYRIQKPEHPERFDITSVQSDWNEASNLWGYCASHKPGSVRFEGTRILRVFLDGWAVGTNGNEQGRACTHTVLLDEMNLSRPEHYASDLLSAMELIGERGET